MKFAANLNLKEHQFFLLTLYTCLLAFVIAFVPLNITKANYINLLIVQIACLIAPQAESSTEPYLNFSFVENRTSV